MEDAEAYLSEVGGASGDEFSGCPLSGMLEGDRQEMLTDHLLHTYASALLINYMALKIRFD